MAPKGLKRPLPDILIRAGQAINSTPLREKPLTSDLRSAATILLHRPHEGQNAVFTERAITMLTQIFHAAKLERQRPLPFTYKILNEGLYGTARFSRLSLTNTISIQTFLPSFLILL